MPGIALRIHGLLIVRMQRGLFVEFFFQMGDHAISAQRVILGVDVLHHLAIWNRVISLSHIAPVSFIKAIPKQCRHRFSDGLLILRIAFDAPVIDRCQNAQSQHAKLLHPVFTDDFPYHIPVQVHSHFLHCPSSSSSRATVRWAAPSPPVRYDSLSTRTLPIPCPDRPAHLLPHNRYPQSIRAFHPPQ